MLISLIVRLSILPNGSPLRVVDPDPRAEGVGPVTGKERTLLEGGW